MLIKLAQAKVYDPQHQIDGQVMDIYIRDGFIVAPPPADEKIDQEYQLAGKVVMSGAIDMHTHIGGGKVNIARMLLPEDHRADPVVHNAVCRSVAGHAAPSTYMTGYRYAEMGYTAAFEPAILPFNARQAHLEMGDIPIIDKGGYAMLGNDDLLLRMMAGQQDQNVINDYVAWTLAATQTIGIKVVNAGGINAFKFNQRMLDLDEKNTHYQITPRQILTTLARAVHELGIAHPLHVHGNNLGVPGNISTTLKTIAGVEGYPLHLTHIQFHSYGAEGDRKFSSGAAEIAEAVNRHRNISVDVGQIMFGQTVTASGDNMRQFANTRHAHPNKWVCMDIECDAGCGVVPFRYKDKNFVNALQWAIGLEIFLLIQDPWRVFLTTDHPNGAPFTSYPHLIKLLMDKTYRNSVFARLHPEAQAMSTLASIQREYTLYEIAIMTRAGAARLLGLADRGHLGVGARADVVVYSEHPDKQVMFAKPDYVFKDGQLVVQHGQVVHVTWGATHTVRPEYDVHIERPIQRYLETYHTIAPHHLKITEQQMMEDGRGHVLVHDAQGRRERLA